MLVEANNGFGKAALLLFMSKSVQKIKMFYAGMSFMIVTKNLIFHGICNVQFRTIQMTACLDENIKLSDIGHNKMMLTVQMLSY